MPLTAPVVGDNNFLYDSLTFGSRIYELSNYLGNVLSTISDKKIGNDSSGTVNYYIAEVLSQNDYYPFGKIQPGRQYGVLGRYTFNGKEYDKETKTHDYGMRIYSEDLGRFLSVDPLAIDYPWYSPYHFAGGNPIMFVDLDGAEPQGFMEYWDKQADGVDRWGRTVQNVHDYQTKQVWSVMREPNSTRVYFWQQYDNEHGNWDNSETNNNFDNKNDKWKGKWVEFKPRSTSEIGKQIADAFGLATFAVFSSIAGGIALEGAISSYGATTVGTTILKEAGEEAFQQITGIPIPGIYDLVKAGLKKTGKAVLGHVEDNYVKYADEIGASRFDLGKKWDEIISSGKDPWDANKYFLDEVVRNGDEVILTRAFKNIREGSTLKREVNYLLDNGYKWKNKTQKTLIKQ